MAKRKRLNRRVVLVISVFGVLLVAGLVYVYIANLPQAPEQYIQKANEALAKDPKDYEAANRALFKAIKAGGDRPNVEHYFKLAELCFDRVENDLGLSQSEKESFYGQGFDLLRNKALVQDPTFNKARRLLASHMWFHALRAQNWGLWKDYIAEVDRILKIDKDDAELYYQRGYAKTQLAKTDSTYNKEALVDYREAVNIDKKNLNFWNSLTNFLTSIEEYDKAEEAYKQAIEANPNKAQIRVNYSVFLRDRKREVEALKLVQEAIKCEPDNPTGYITLAQHNISKKQLDEAEKALQQAQKIDKTDVRIYTHYTWIFQLRKDLPGAMKALQEGLKVLELKGDESATNRFRRLGAQGELNYWLADIALDIYVSAKEQDAKTEVLDLARRYYEKLVKLRPEHPQRYRIAGRFATIERKWEEARKFFEKSLSKGFNLKTAMVLIDVYKQLKIPTRGEALVSRILSSPDLIQDQDQTKLYFLLQQAQFRMDGRYYDTARELTERVLKIDPENKTAKKFIQALNIAEGKINELPKGASTNILVRRTLARRVREYILNDQFDQAEDILEKILAQNPKDKEALSQLLLLLTQTNQKDKAIDRVKQSLNDDPDDENLKRLLVLLQEPKEQERFKIEMGFADQASDPLEKAMNKWKICLRYGRSDEARKYLQEAEEIDPQNALVIEALFRHALQKQDWKTANLANPTMAGTLLLSFARHRRYSSFASFHFWVNA